VDPDWIRELSLAASFASIAGFVFSLLAWLRARGAEQLAREAREAVRRGNAAEDLQSLAAMAKDFLACVENDQIEAACLRARDLVFGINQAKERWRGILLDETGERLFTTSKQVSSVSRNLSMRHAKITPDERDRLLRFCHEVITTLSAETGKIQSLIERALSHCFLCAESP